MKCQYTNLKPYNINKLNKISLFFLSAAALLFEIDLSRLFSVAQFYHFAFMVVSLALLGYGASGTALTLWRGLAEKSSGLTLAWLSLAGGLSILAAYLLTNYLPFDSFSIAWDGRQILILAAHYLALTLPFFFNGLVVGLLLSAAPEAAGRTYAANLLGSAVGCLAALAFPGWLGGEGIVVLSSGLAFMAAALSTAGGYGLWVRIARLAAIAGLVFVLADVGMRLGGQGGFSFLSLRLSPYKGLSYILQQPGTKIEAQHWNSYSRVDVVSGPGIHSFAGLSYRYLKPLPAQQGLLVDGDDLRPLLGAGSNLDFSAYLPSAIAFQLRPGARALVLGAGGGQEALAALAQGAERVDAVEANPLITAAAPAYADGRIRSIVEDERSYLRRGSEQYGVIILALNTTFHPIRSGAYSLAEDYRYTVEAFTDALLRLEPGGFFVVNRWLQDPPSEDLRAFALAVSALDGLGLDPAPRIVALRGYNTATLLVGRQPFTNNELDGIRRFAAERAFDLSYAPGLQEDESNIFNVLPEPSYFRDYQSLLQAEPRQVFYDAYPFEVSPPTDDRPFFGHFFKWAQTGQVLAELGKTWQPFGGAGYFVILALLALALLLAGGLILLPVLLARFKSRVEPKGPHLPAAFWFYFAAIGGAYLLVEIPLIQKYILYHGPPAYAMTAVLFTVLLFSGIGSSTGKKVPLKISLSLLALLLLAYPALLPALFQRTLAWPFLARLLLAVALLAPAGFLMGIPFQSGIHLLEARGLSAYIPWTWAVNGFASVVSAVLAALLALSFGFSWVLWLGALGYAAAWLASRTMARSSQPPG